MATMQTGNTYYEAAKKRTNPDDAGPFLKKAINEYMVLRNQSSDTTERKMASDKIDECLDYMDRMNHPEKYTRKRIAVGSNSVDEPKQKFDITVPGTTFDDVAGMQDVKEEITEAVIWPLVHADKFKDFVGETGEGILLYGPPGCGKTYILKAAAGEASKQCKARGLNYNVSFIYIQAKDVLDSWVGNSEKNLSRAFEFAVEKEPSILFFDDLDSIGCSRSGQSTYADRLLTQFLTSFSIIEGKKVLVAGATNTPWKIDAALQRSGRIGTKILVGPPNDEARKEIFKLHTKGRKIAADIDFGELAKYTDCYASSDIKQVCKKSGKNAMVEALKNPERKIEYTDFVRAINETRSSLYTWCDEVEKQVRKKNVTPEYVNMIGLMEEILEKRSKSNSNEKDVPTTEGPSETDNPDDGESEES